VTTRAGAVSGPEGSLRPALDAADVAAYARFTDTASDVDCARSFVDWCDRLLRPFLGIDRLMCCLGRVNGGQLTVDGVQAIGWPPDALPQVGTVASVSVCLARHRCFATGEPQWIRASSMRCPTGCACEWSVGSAHTARVNLLHGTRGADGQSSSYFICAGVAAQDTALLGLKARMVAPYLHQALGTVARQRLQDSALQPTLTPLSPRELAVLAWVQAGKTNAEIAQIQNRSPDTIKHQVRSLMAKLQVPNRSQAVIRAFELGLLRPKGRSE
jgi:DNA-binding CsgD family transcriptional regulator